MIEKVKAELTELRLDWAGTNQAKVRLGLMVTVVTVAVTASGWPPVDVVQRAVYFVLVAIPSTGVGLGIVVDELMRSRWNRRGERRADDREVRALRARIREDAQARLGAAGTDVVHVGEAGIEPSTRARAASRPPPPRRRLVRRGRARAPFQAGVLRLR